VTAAEVEILPAPNWALLKVAVEGPDVLAKAMPSMLRKPLTPSDFAPLRSMLVPAPAVPIWRVSVPPPPLYLSPDPTWAVLATMKVSFSLPPTMLSLPVEPVSATVSLVVQLLNVQAERSSEPPDAMLMARVLVAALAVTTVPIFPAPNWALLNVAVEVPEEVAKATPSMLMKPFTPSDAAPLR